MSKQDERRLARRIPNGGAECVRDESRAPEEAAQASQRGAGKKATAASKRPKEA